MCLCRASINGCFPRWLRSGEIKPQVFLNSARTNKEAALSHIRLAVIQPGPFLLSPLSSAPPLFSPPFNLTLNQNWLLPGISSAWGFRFVSCHLKWRCMGSCRQPWLSLDVQQGLRCQKPFPGQGPDQNEIRSIYLIPDCAKPISAVIYSH